MPGKHVRFADSVIDTPSPSWSDASLPSTVGPITPPSNPFPLPSLHGSIVRIHNLLGASFAEPQLVYDVSLPAQTALPRDPTVSSWVLSQPATEPVLPFIEIISPRLPWRLAIYPAQRGSPVVTVGDVLAGIYAHLRTPVSAAEYALVGQEDVQRRIGDAFRRRCKRQPSAEAVARETGKGLKRVDFLEGVNVFGGLSTTKEGGHVWQMNTS